MDVLDEKTNGGPPMEVDEIVSVRDGACQLYVDIRDINR
jgi:hypothetical protein